MTDDRDLRGGLTKKELSVEQQKHKRQNEYRKYEQMEDKKLDGPNRPSE